MLGMFLECGCPTGKVAPNPSASKDKKTTDVIKEQTKPKDLGKGQDQGQPAKPKDPDKGKGQGQLNSSGTKANDAEMNQELQQLKKRYNEAKNAWEERKTKQKKLQENIKDLEEKLSNKADEISKLEDKLKPSIIGQILNLRDIDLESKLAIMQSEEKVLDSEIKRLKQELKEYTSDAQSEETHLKTLEEVYEKECEKIRQKYQKKPNNL